MFSLHVHASVGSVPAVVAPAGWVMFGAFISIVLCDLLIVGKGVSEDNFFL